MASELRKLTKLGADTRKIAALLQSKGRGRDTVLAHITPEEADLLKARGGRGSINPETGLPEFEDDYFGPGQGDEGMTVVPPPAPQPQSTADMMGGPELGAAPEPAPMGDPRVAALYSNEGYTGSVAGTGAPTPEAAPSFGQAALDKLKGMAPSDDFLKRLGLAGVQAIPGIVQGRRAAQQAGTYKGEQQALAAPYQQLGRQLQAQAQAGTLTPQAQRSLQAARAQMAQGAEARGGVGAQQASAALEGLRQQLLQQQFDYGLKLSGIGDNIALGAIRTGMQADQYVNNLTSQFYNNLFRTLSGQPLAAPAPAQAPTGG